LGNKLESESVSQKTNAGNNKNVSCGNKDCMLFQEIGGHEILYLGENDFQPFVIKNTIIGYTRGSQ
jgi:hypothetical protein